MHQVEDYTRATLPVEIDIPSKGCKDCSLSEKSFPIRPRGNYDARVILVGEAPGKVEEAENCFFIGPAGRLLAEATKGLGFSLDENFFVMNTVLCRPHPPAGVRKENRLPTATEIAECRPHLEKIVEAHNPDLVVVIGGVAAKAVMKKYPGSVGRTVNRFFGSDEHNLPTSADLFAIWHPAYILRNMTEKPGWTKQLVKLRDYMIGRGLVIG